MRKKSILTTILMLLCMGIPLCGFIACGEREEGSLDSFEYEKTESGCVINKVKDKSATKIIVPDSVTEIKKGAFSGCSNLEELSLPFIGFPQLETLFSDTEYLTVYPLGYIFGEEEFEGATRTWQFCAYGSSEDNLDNWIERDFYIPDNLKKVTVKGGNIEAYSFYQCQSITEITLSDTVTKIRKWAFFDCNNLTTINIPDSVESIAGDAFLLCDSLEAIYYKGAEERWISNILSKKFDLKGNEPVYFYSKSEPALLENGTAYNGNYWHYDKNGKPTPWIK